MPMYFCRVSSGTDAYSDSVHAVPQFTERCEEAQPYGTRVFVASAVNSIRLGTKVHSVTARDALTSEIGVMEAL